MGLYEIAVFLDNEMTELVEPQNGDTVKGFTEDDVNEIYPRSIDQRESTNKLTVKSTVHALDRATARSGLSSTGSLPCECGGIGRRNGLKTQFLWCGVEP